MWCDMLLGHTHEYRRRSAYSRNYFENDGNFLIWLHDWSNSSVVIWVIQSGIKPSKQIWNDKWNGIHPTSLFSWVLCFCYTNVAMHMTLQWPSLSSFMWTNIALCQSSSLYCLIVGHLFISVNSTSVGKFYDIFDCKITLRRFLNLSSHWYFWKFALGT